MTPRSAQSASFRPEIQGLRAVASFLVAIFHIWLGRVSGGVDVFFVASGYLITTSLIKPIVEMPNGVVSGVQFLKFWARLVKRLLPASLFVLAATFVATIVLLPQSRWGATLGEIVASTLYVENWQLALSAVDYLDRENARSPVQHYWALSVQGQFYLLWPLVVQLSVLLARRAKAKVSSVLTASMVATFVLSLAYSVYATAHNQPFTYFSSVARIWEFSIGGLLALTLPKLRLSQWARTLLGWVGLLAILSCGLLLRVSTIFPGYAALWPTLGAALVLTAGGSSGRFSAGRLLSSKPLAYVGDISYSIYLWHWPLLIFYQVVSDEQRLGLVEGSGILAVSFVLAMGTTRWVEDPVRRSAIGQKHPARALVFGLACMAPLLAAASAMRAYLRQAERDEKVSLAHVNPDYPGPAAMTAGFVYRGAADVPVRPSAMLIGKDLPAAYRDDCHQTLTGEEALSCTYGAKKAEKTMAIVGGSHSLQWLPALEVIAKRDSWRIVTFTKSSCLFSNAPKDPAVPPSQAVAARRHSCKKWNDNVLDALLELAPELVFTTSTRANRKEKAMAGSVPRWESLGRAGIEVVAIRDNPWMGFNVPECVEREGAQGPRCSRPREEVLAKVSPIDSLAAPLENVRLVDLTDYFCTETTCPPVIGNVLVYRDKHHISATYARMLAPYLEAQMFPKSGN